MAEVLIEIRRPPSMTLAEMRAWVVQRALTDRPRMALEEPADGDPDRLRLRVEAGGYPGWAGGGESEIGAGRSEQGEDALDDLIMDMRLLGFSPVLSSSLRTPRDPLRTPTDPLRTPRDGCGPRGILGDPPGSLRDPYRPPRDPRRAHG